MDLTYLPTDTKIAFGWTAGDDLEKRHIFLYKYIYMPISKKLIKYLDSNKARYEIVKHKTVYTAYDKAATLKVKPKLIGKTLVIKTDSDLALVLIPGNKNLDKNKFKKVVSDWQKKQGLKPIKKLDFISEKAMKNKFKGMKIGAVPPFGDLWKLPTFVDRSLINQPKIIVNTGDYNNSIKIKSSFLKKLILGMVIGNFTQIKK